MLWAKNWTLSKMEVLLDAPAVSPRFKGRIQCSKHNSRSIGNSKNSAFGVRLSLLASVSTSLCIFLNIASHQSTFYWPNMNQSSGVDRKKQEPCGLWGASSGSGLPSQRKKELLWAAIQILSFMFDLLDAFFVYFPIKILLAY